jgi:hypothetical protein
MQSSGLVCHEELEHLVVLIPQHLDKMPTNHTLAPVLAGHSYHQKLISTVDDVKETRKYVS